MAVDQAPRAEGIWFYSVAVARRPHSPDAYSNLGGALRAQKKYAEAEAACRQAIALKHDFPQAYVNLGNTLRAQKKYAAAEAAYGKAIAIKNDYPAAHNN